MASRSEGILQFGHTRHAYLGRFFAAHKYLSTKVLDYDIKPISKLFLRRGLPINTTANESVKERKPQDDPNRSNVRASSVGQGVRIMSLMMVCRSVYYVLHCTMVSLRGYKTPLCRFMLRNYVSLILFVLLEKI